MSTNTERLKQTTLAKLPTPTLPTRKALEINYTFTDTALEKHGLILTQTINYNNITDYDTFHIHNDCYDLHIYTDHNQYTLPCVTEDFLEQFQTHAPVQ